MYMNMVGGVVNIHLYCHVLHVMIDNSFTLCQNKQLGNRLRVAQLSILTGVGIGYLIGLVGVQPYLLLATAQHA